MSLIEFLQELAEAAEDIKDENEKKKRSIETAKMLQKRRKRG